MLVINYFRVEVRGELCCWGAGHRYGNVVYQELERLWRDTRALDTVLVERLAEVNMFLNSNSADEILHDEDDLGEPILVRGQKVGPGCSEYVTYHVPRHWFLAGYGISAYSLYAHSQGIVDVLHEDRELALGCCQVDHNLAVFVCHSRELVQLHQNF